MKILFLMINKSESKNSSGMYEDLAANFIKEGHSVTIMAPTQNSNTKRINEDGIDVLSVRTLPLLGVNSAIKKGLGLIQMKYAFKKAFIKYLRNEKFDWVFMPTPPITLVDFVEYIKNKLDAKFYLILRDIHPQSLHSIGALKNKLMFKYLNAKAQKGYRMADIIGCMSKGNIEYIKEISPKINERKLKLLFNWMDAKEYTSPNSKVREKYGLKDKFVALFGGNIGKGQRIENIVRLAEHFKENDSIVFLIIGKGVLKDKLKRIAHEKNLTNIRIEDFLPREEYLDIVKSVDLGLISIDENYAVPTCPSKVLSYMSLKIPVFAMINDNNDYGAFIQEKAKAGLWCVGGDKNLDAMISKFEVLYNDDDFRTSLGKSGFKFFNEYLTTECAYKNIMNQISNHEKIK